MTSSGLQSMLESVHAGNTVPYMLSGKAISGAVRGHLLVGAALHAIFMLDMYNCHILLSTVRKKAANYHNFSIWQTT